MKPTLRLTVLLALLIQAISLPSGSYAGGRLWPLAGSQGSGPIAPPPHESLSYDRLNSQLAGSVVGCVTDANTTQPLPNANVYLSGITDPAFEDSTWTDGEGCYSFDLLLPADYELRAAAYGYYSSNAEVTIVQDTTLIQDFALDAAIPELSDRSIVEVCELGTPHTIERYTENTGGSHCGYTWDRRANTINPAMGKFHYKHERVSNLYFIGHWTGYLGGVTNALWSARHIARALR